jgi:putative FmdB family regulatory protein
MPFYRYECRTCGQTFRVLHRNGTSSPTRCPSCGGKEADRLLPRIGVIYKGSGYYSTDYRSKEREKKSGSTQSETTATASRAESPGED